MRRLFPVAILGLCLFACANLGTFEKVTNGELDPATSNTPGNGNGNGNGNGPDDPSSGQVVEPPLKQDEGDVEITPAELEFGAVNCGTRAPSKQIVIKNKTNAIVDYDVKAPEGSGFLIEGTVQGQIPANGTVTLAVTTQPLSASSFNGGILVTAGKSYLEVLAKATGNGGVVEVSNGAPDFGQVRKGQTATPIPIELKNTGTSDVTIDSWSGQAAGLSITPPAPITIPQGQAVTVTAAYTAPDTIGASNATFKATTASPLCATMPEISAKGQSIDTTVSLSVADFGTPSCNVTNVADKTVTVSNYSPNPISITGLAFNEPTRFIVKTQGTVDVPGANGSSPGTKTITIGAKPTGAQPGTFEEQLSMNIAGVDPPGGGPRTTPVKIVVRGALLEMTPPTHDFTSNGYYEDGTNFKITNTGNQTISVDYNFERTKGPASWFYDRSVDTLDPGETANVNMSFRPPTSSSSSTEFEAKLTARRYSGATSCSPTMPFVIGRGKKN